MPVMKNDIVIGRKNAPQQMMLDSTELSIWRNAIQQEYECCTTHKERNSLFRNVYQQARKLPQPYDLWIDHPIWVYNWICYDIDHKQKKIEMDELHRSNSIWTFIHTQVQQLDHRNTLIGVMLKAQRMAMEHVDKKASAFYWRDDSAAQKKAIEKRTTLQGYVHDMLRAPELYGWIETHSNKTTKMQLLIAWMGAMQKNPDVYCIFPQYPNLWEPFLQYLEEKSPSSMITNMQKHLYGSPLLWEKLRAEPAYYERFVQWVLLQQHHQVAPNTLGALRIHGKTINSENAMYRKTMLAFFQDEHVPLEKKSWIRYLLNDQLKPWDCRYMHEISKDVPHNPAEMVNELCSLDAIRPWALEEYAKHQEQYSHWGSLTTSLELGVFDE